MIMRSFSFIKGSCVGHHDAKNEQCLACGIVNACSKDTLHNPDKHRFNFMGKDKKSMNTKKVTKPKLKKTK